MTVSPLLACLIWLTRYFGTPATAEKILSGLPATAFDLDFSLLERAASNVHMDVCRQSLTGDWLTDKSPLPCLVISNGKPLIITHINANGLVVSTLKPYDHDESNEVDYGVLLNSIEKDVYFFSPKPNSHNTLSSTEQYFEHHWFWGALWSGWRIYREVLLVSLLVNLFALAVPLFVRLIYDRVIPGMAMTTLNTLVAGVLLVVTFELFCRQLRIRFIDVAAKKTDLIMSSELFAKVMNVDLSSVPPVAGAFARQVQDFESIREFLTSTTLTVLVEIPFAFIFLLVIMVMGGSIVWIPIIVILVMVGLSVFVQPSLRRSIQEGEKLSTQKHGDLVESISGLESLRLAGGQSYFQKRWEQATGLMATCGLRTRAITGNMSALSVWLQQMATIGIVYFGVRFIHQSQMNMGALIAIMMLSGRAIAPFMQLSLLGARYWQAKTAYRNIDGLMQAPEETSRSESYRPLTPIQQTIVFDQVSFSYPGCLSPTLKDLSFTIKRGERIAIVGRSGSGKSTLARLLAALYLPDSGQIYLDGISLKDIHPVTLRENIGFLAQEPWLFNGAVAANMMMGAKVKSEEHVLSVAQQSGVTMFTGESIAGLEYPVGEGGRNISGGQRRAVALARALINNPGVVVLDEPSAHMDSMMDARVQQTLQALPEHVTLVVITHRSSLLSIVDRVLMLEGGRLVSDQAVIKKSAHG
ncbi:type I secretion system permease/ATPase [uncultured Endozoicomonas sp.]|uniref:type I secretion system permease/ATPase n=1 Tax=uncultured Endozoicomonas sp. TaxID=432652 RepID=UPI002618A7F5|nr:type I secretion system permease/ATPase [uncultured Endozoicomonas sp.]